MNVSPGQSLLCRFRILWYRISFSPSLNRRFEILFYAGLNDKITCLSDYGALFMLCIKGNFSPCVTTCFVSLSMLFFLFEFRHKGTCHGCPSVHVLLHRYCVRECVKCRQFPNFRWIRHCVLVSSF